MIICILYTLYIYIYIYDIYIYIYNNVSGPGAPGSYEAAVPATATFHAGKRTFFATKQAPATSL